MIDEIVLKLENKDYDNIYLLKKLDNKYSLKIDYVNSFVTSSLTDFIAMRETLNYFKNLIEQANLSNLEKITYAYDIIKSFEYQESETKEDSRYIHNIIRDGKIVCVGYSVFLGQLLKELGIENYAISTTVPVNGEFFGHERNIINVQDEKYDINGFYAFDATWDCAHGFVKCIDKDNEIKIKPSNKLDLEDRIIKKYDDIVSYRYFLIPGSNYCDVFKGEKMPNFENAKHFDTNLNNTDLCDLTDDFIENHGMDNEQFIKLIKTVRLKEGYSIDNMDSIVDDVIDIKNLNSKNNQSVIKR